MTKILGAVCAAYFLFFGFLAFQKSQCLENGDDFPQYLQAMWSTLHGHPYQTNWQYVGGSKNSLLGMHLEFTLLLLLPLYALWQDPGVILIAQVLIVVLASFPVYFAANYLLKNPFCSLCFALALLANPYIQKSLFYDFHPESLQFLFLVCAASFLIQRRTRIFIVFALLAVLTKEDSLIQIFFLGLYALIFQRERKVGIGTMVSSAILFMAASSFILPFFRGEPNNIFLERYPLLGHDIPSVIQTLLFKPKMLFHIIWDHKKLYTQFLILLMFAFLPLFSLRSILLILPATGLTMLTQFDNLKTLCSPYPFSMLPFYPFAAMLGLSNLMTHFSENLRTKYMKAGAMALLSLTFCAAFFYPVIAHKDVSSYQAYYLNRPPLSEGFSWSYFLQNDHIRTGHRFIRENIPPDVPLSAEYRMASHVANRSVLQPVRANSPEEWVFFDMWGNPYCESLELFRLFLERKDYGVVAFEDGYTLLRRGADPSRNKNILKLASSFVEAEFLYHLTGANIGDTEARNKLTRFGKAGEDSQNYLTFGPYISLESGDYEIRFILKTEEVIKERYLGQEIALLEVYDSNTQEIYQKKAIFVNDFASLGKYQSVTVSFHLEKPAERIEFRTWFYSRADLWVDRIEWENLRL